MANRAIDDDRYAFEYFGPCSTGRFSLGQLDCQHLTDDPCCPTEHQEFIPVLALYGHVPNDPENAFGRRRNVESRVTSPTGHARHGRKVGAQTPSRVEALFFGLFL
jgi:hypothetical protein